VVVQLGRRPRAALAAAFVAAFVAGAVSLGCSARSDTTAGTDAGTSRSATTQPAFSTGTVTRLVEIATSSAPDIVEAHGAGSQAWYTAPGSTQLTRVTVLPDGTSTADNIALPAPANSSHWALAGDTPYVITTAGVVVVDPATGTPGPPVAGEGGEVVGEAFGVDRVWLVRRAASGVTIESWNLALSDMVTVHPLDGGAPSTLLGGNSEVFALSGDDGLLHTDNEGRTQIRIPGPQRSAAVALDDNARPLALDRDGTLRRIDPTTNVASVATSALPDGIVAIGRDETLLLTANGRTNMLQAFDLASLRLVSTTALPGTPASIDVAGGTIWVSGPGWWACYRAV